MKLIYRLIFIFSFILILFFLIAYARGYRIDFKKKNLSSTGILAITSNPKAAKIYINGEFKGVTDSNITLPPDHYQVEIKKEGYTSWTKKITLKGELVISLDALLFPLNPSLSPLTNLGVKKAIPIEQTDRILLFIESGDETKDGIYLFDAGKKLILPLSPVKLVILKKNLPALTDFSLVNTYFSPDFRQVIIESQKEEVSYLLSLNEENLNAFDITASKETLLEAWQKEKEKNHLKILETFPKEITKIATDSFKIISFSPNETKLLYQAKRPINLPLAINPPLIASNQTPETRNLEKDRFYVYDKKEDKNYEINLINLIDPISKQHLNTTEAKNRKPDIDKLEINNFIQWFPDSKRLVFIEGRKIVIIDYDGTNKQIIYSGPFENSFFNVASDSLLIVLTNLNPETNAYPDLYAVGIK